MLQPLPARPYPSLLLAAPTVPRAALPLPQVVVERRSLAAYAALAGADT